MSTTEELREQVAGPDDDGVRLDRFVAGLLESRAQAQKAIADGRVKVNGERVVKSRAVLSGQRVSVLVPADKPVATISPEQSDVPIVFQDDTIVVVDKPAGMVVHPAPGHRGVTLVEALGGRTAGGSEDRPGVVHRLDRDTSGLLVLARSDSALRTLQAALSERRIKREYLALVQGTPPARTGTIDAPIGRDPRDRTRMAIDGDSPREATTHFSVLEHLGLTTFLAVTLDTGRTHQIRVHLEAIGHPVVGDPTYGEGAAYGLDRQWLHATRLTLEHPVTGEELVLESAPPADLERALAAARADASVV
ncbi:MAG: RluA family pseudouridine synthase [Solirubrobacteraceae bacterium]|nr:RluA family pseudouridine synthase [Patulibacter sp.]